MKTCHTFKWVALGVTLPLLLTLEVSFEGPLWLTFGHEAAAIVGRPFTPVSVAGVARRTTRRVVVAETSATAAAATTAASSQQATAHQQAATAQQQQATAQQQAATAQQQSTVAQQQAKAAGAPAIGSVVSTLPAGCVADPKGGVEYQKCGSVYYREAFQGNNLVYVVQPQP